MFSVDIAPFLAAKAYMDTMVDRASMYAVRQAGREVDAAAKGVVPVLSGQLRGSIKNARKMKRSGAHDFTLSTGPMGYPSFLYAGKIEGEHPYMDPAAASIEGRMGSIFEEAQAKVLGRFA